MDNVIGRTYNELTIESFVDKPDTDKYKSWNTSAWVRCRCSCNKVVDLPLYGVAHGLIKSCGHYRSQRAAETLEKIRETNPTPNAVYLTYEGKTQNIAEWAKETGIPRSTIMYRLSRELPIEEVLRRKESDNEYRGPSPEQCD